MSVSNKCVRLRINQIKTINDLLLDALTYMKVHNLNSFYYKHLTKLYFLTEFELMKMKNDKEELICGLFEEDFGSKISIQHGRIVIKVLIGMLTKLYQYKK